MALTRIYVFPGIGGSYLYSDGLTNQAFWAPSIPGIVYTQLFMAGFVKLLMNDDGTSKFPVTYKPIIDGRPKGRLSELCYENTVNTLRKDFEVVEMPYDFRFLPSQIEGGIFIERPGYFLCHSMGCLVASEIYARLKRVGQEDKALGFIFCGGPFQLNASAEAVKIFTDTPNAFKYLACANWVSHAFTAKPLPPLFNGLTSLEFTFPLAAIVQVLSSWSSISTLIPNLPEEVVTEAFYKKYPYGRYVKQAWLDRGRDEKERNLASAKSIPPGKVIEIIGSGVPTIPHVGYPADMEGDGVVHNNAALDANGTFAISQGVHRNLLDDPRVAQIVKLAITSNFTVTGSLDLSLLPANGGQWRPKIYELPNRETAVFVNGAASQLFDPDP